jgi:hypothetical protein
MGTQFLEWSKLRQRRGLAASANALVMDALVRPIELDML